MVSHMRKLWVELSVWGLASLNSACRQWHLVGYIHVASMSSIDSPDLLCPRNRPARAIVAFLGIMQMAAVLPRMKLRLARGGMGRRDVYSIRFAGLLLPRSRPSPNPWDHDVRPVWTVEVFPCVGRNLDNTIKEYQNQPYCRQDSRQVMQGYSRRSCRTYRAMVGTLLFHLSSHYTVAGDSVRSAGRCRHDSCRQASVSLPGPRCHRAPEHDAARA